MEMPEKLASNVVVIAKVSSLPYPAPFYPRLFVPIAKRLTIMVWVTFNLSRSPLPFFLALALLCSPSTARPMVVDNPFLTIAIDRFVVGFILILSAVVVDWSLDKIDGWTNVLDLHADNCEA